MLDNPRYAERIANQELSSKIRHLLSSRHILWIVQKSVIIAAILLVFYSFDFL